MYIRILLNDSALFWRIKLLYSVRDEVMKHFAENIIVHKPTVQFKIFDNILDTMLRSCLILDIYLFMG